MASLSYKECEKQARELIRSKDDALKVAIQMLNDIKSGRCMDSFEYLTKLARIEMMAMPPLGLDVAEIDLAAEEGDALPLRPAC